MTTIDRISDELYEEMDLWYGALVEAFADETDWNSIQFTETEEFLNFWKHEVGVGMGVSCIRLNCGYCNAGAERQADPVVPTISKYRATP